MAKNNKRKKSGHLYMQSATACISTTLVLLLLGLIVFLALTAHNLSNYVRENMNFSIVISNDMKEQDILQFQQQLNKEPFVKSSEYISKQQALKEQNETMGIDHKEFIGYNPFFASLEIKMRSDYANSDSIAKVEKLIKKNKHVQEIIYQKDLIDQMNKNIRHISLALFGLMLVLILISFALINNTIRLTIYANRFLIHTMKLVGASHSLIRQPFMVRNLWIGIGAAVLANIILCGSAYGLVQQNAELQSVITPQTMVIVGIAVLCFGIIITLLCAWFSINKYLKMKSNTLYYV